MGPDRTRAIRLPHHPAPSGIRVIRFPPTRSFPSEVDGIVTTACTLSSAAAILLTVASAAISFRRPPTDLPPLHAIPTPSRRQLESNPTVKQQADARFSMQHALAATEAAEADDLRPSMRPAAARSSATAASPASMIPTVGPDGHSSSNSGSISSNTEIKPPLSLRAGTGAEEEQASVNMEQASVNMEWAIASVTSFIPLFNFLVGLRPNFDAPLPGLLLLSFLMYRRISPWSDSCQPRLKRSHVAIQCRHGCSRHSLPNTSMMVGLPIRREQKTFRRCTTCSVFCTPYPYSALVSTSMALA